SILDDEAARIKHQTDAPSIRPLVNSLFAASLLSTTPGAIKERLVTAETSFRTTHPKTIIIGSIVNAANAFASATQLPRYSETIHEQVVMLRMTLLKYFPTLLQPPIVAAAPDYQSFSPVGALFLTDLILRQKLTNPKYQ